jgi:hypothetical protein
MRGVTDAQATWLRERVMQPPAGTNTIIVTHMPNISRAFPAWGTVEDARRSSWALVVAWRDESKSRSGLA